MEVGSEKRLAEGSPTGANPTRHPPGTRRRPDGDAAYV